MPQSTLLRYFKSSQPELPALNYDHAPAETDLLAPRQSAREDLTHTSNEGVCMLTEKVSSVNEVEQASLDFFVPPNQLQATIVKVNSSHIAKLKNITNTLLPVRYPDKFFNEVVTDEITSNLSRVLLWSEQPVGWIRCRLEVDDRAHKQVYIQALGLLAPYRGCGLATCLLDQVVRSARFQQYGATAIYCHVWESNQDAIEWYEKRGFTRLILIQQYYRKLRPAGAYIMRRITDLT